MHIGYNDAGGGWPHHGGGDMMDGAHPNESGYRKMADVWYAQLDALICK